MEEKYKAYKQYSFAQSEKWQAHLNNVYPPPKYNEIDAYKKRWYRKNIDPEFDINYVETTPAYTQPPQQPTPPINRKKYNIWKYQCVLYCLYLAFTFSPLTFNWWHAAPFMLAIIMELLNKYGAPKFSKEWWSFAITDEYTQCLMYAGLSSYMSKVSFAPKVPNIIYAVMFIMIHFGFIIKKKKDGLVSKLFGKCVAFTDKNWANLEEFVHTYEIYVGFYLIVCFYPLKLVGIFAPIGYWYMLQFRYMLSAQTKSAFAKLGMQMESIKNHRLCPRPIGWLITGIKYAAGFFTRMVEQNQEQQAQPTAQPTAQPNAQRSSCSIF